MTDRRNQLNTMTEQFQQSTSLHAVSVKIKNNDRRRWRSIPYNNWEEAYAAERRTTIIHTTLFLCFASALNPLALCVAHDYAPRYQLPDIVFNLIEEQSWARIVADIGVTLAAMMILFTGMLIHRYRLIVMRRITFIAGVLYLLRFCTLVSTQLPIPYRNASLYCAPPFPHTTSYQLYLKRFAVKIILFGTSSSQNDLCGDLLFSGHTIVFTLAMMTSRTYLPKKLQWSTWLISPLCMFGMLCLIMSRLHYTVDVLISYWLTGYIFNTYHTICHVPHHERKRCMTTKTLLFGRATKHLERKTPHGKLPNQCNLPFGLPTMLNRMVAKFGDSTSETIANYTQRAVERNRNTNNSEEKESHCPLLTPFDNGTSSEPSSLNSPSIDHQRFKNRLDTFLTIE